MYVLMRGKTMKLALADLGWMKKIQTYHFYDPRETFNMNAGAFAAEHYGGTVHWFPSDTKEKYEQHLQDKEKNKLLEENGWIDKQIDYHLGIQGFRHDGTQPDITSEKGGVLWLGDSNTFGTGIEIERTWPWICHHMNDITKNLRYINFGCPGYGIETYYRLLRFYINDVKPDYVIMTNPWISTRAEEYNEHKYWGVLTPRDDLSFVEHHRIFSDHASMIRWIKNLDAIKWLCHLHGAKLVCPEDCDSKLVNDFRHRSIKNSLARELMHPGYENHKYNAEVMDRVIYDVCNAS